MPPNRTTLPPDPRAPIFGNGHSSKGRETEPANEKRGALLERSNTLKRQEVASGGVDVMNPPYSIENAAGQGELSDRTAYVSVLVVVGSNSCVDVVTGGHYSCKWPRYVRYS